MGHLQTDYLCQNNVIVTLRGEGRYVECDVK